ncbi:MAG TPA: hypothetical protein VL358_08805 [Caulobacteraceae bacterium]|jgi:Flp pilus assembly protein TadG|nr:hypothetical protein [Caulobacteraceae bacterium]
MKRLSGLLRDSMGVAAVEMALVAPVLAALALVAFSVWQTASRIEDMRLALKAGSTYYMNGGTDDPTAQSLMLQSWPTPPANAAVSVQRICQCAGVAAACGTLCSGSTPPAVYVTLSATATASNGVNSIPLSEQKVVRVR